MTGIPAEAFDFYDLLAVDNSREFWAEHKSQYEAHVRAPLQELADAVQDDYGPAHLYRPYRDVRFSKDKRPIKDHQGCVFEAENGLGWYMQISANGFMVAGGWYMSTPSQVKRYREYILEAGGTRIRKAVESLPKEFTLGGDMLKTKPRGVSNDNPDLDLLRHRTMHATRVWEPAAWMESKRLETTVRKSFDSLTPMITTLADVVGPPDER